MTPLRVVGLFLVAAIVIAGALLAGCGTSPEPEPLPSPTPEPELVRTPAMDAYDLCMERAVARYGAQFSQLTYDSAEDGWRDIVKHARADCAPSPYPPCDPMEDDRY